MENIFDLFREDDGRVWFKGNTHSHTALSDGKYTTRQVVDLYRDAEYDFLFLTDHLEKMDDPGEALNFSLLSTPRMLVMPGFEKRVDIGNPKERDMHVLSLGIGQSGTWRRDWSPEQLVQSIWREGGLPVIAHPEFSGITEAEIFQARTAFAVEVYNTTADIECDRGTSRHHWDFLLRRGVRVYGIAADDAHCKWEYPSDCGKAWIRLKCDCLCPEGVLNGLRSGSFYASTGPEFFNVSRHNDWVTVDTSPVRRINCHHGSGYRKTVHADRGGTIEGAVFHLPSARRQQRQYIRFECVDPEGRYAWSNPWFIPNSLA